MVTVPTRLRMPGRNSSLGNRGISARPDCSGSCYEADRVGCRRIAPRHPPTPPDGRFARIRRLNTAVCTVTARSDGKSRRPASVAVRRLVTPHRGAVSSVPFEPEPPSWPHEPHFLPRFGLPPAGCDGSRRSGHPRWDASVQAALAATKSISRPPPTNFPHQVIVRFDVQEVVDALGD